MDLRYTIGVQSKLRILVLVPFRSFFGLGRGAGSRGQASAFAFARKDSWWFLIHVVSRLSRVPNAVICCLLLVNRDHPAIHIRGIKAYSCCHITLFRGN